MPTLHVRGVSSKVYAELKRHARAQGRSLTEQVKFLIGESLRQNNETQEQILARLRTLRQQFKLRRAGAPGIVGLLREDRNR